VSTKEPASRGPGLEEKQQFVTRRTLWALDRESRKKDTRGMLRALAWISKTTTKASEREREGKTWAFVARKREKQYIMS